MSADMLSAAYHNSPIVTPERDQAWADWLSDYVIHCADGWVAQGGTRDDVLRSTAGVFADFAEIDDLPWMPLGAALLHQMGAFLEPGPYKGGARIDFMQSLRTLKTSTEHDRTLAAAYQYGISPQQAAQLIADTRRLSADATATAGTTALYRHFDDLDQLLYVGITNDPTLRADQHDRDSRWFRFVASTDTEWFDTRKAADEAERVAIRDESPIFNQTHNKANRDAAIGYLFAALEQTA